MATKTITIKEDVYNKLLRLKRENESFSDLLERLARNANSIELLKKMAGTIEFDDVESLKRELRTRRSEWR